MVSVKVLLGIILLMVACVCGGGYANSLLKKEVDSALQEMTADDSPSPIYRYMITQDAEPSWQMVEFDGFAFSVPYSPDWTVSGTGISMYDLSPSSSLPRIIRFGRPSNGGTYISREYFAYREFRTHAPDQNSFGYLKQNLSCVDGFVPRIRMIGDIEGLEHHIGGAKGCATGFVFNRGEDSYFVYKVPDFGKDSLEIDEEMKRVIESIE